MAKSVMPKERFDHPSIQRALSEVRKVTTKPDVVFRSFLIQITKPMDEFVALLNAMFYHIGLDAASNHFLTPGDRVHAVAADLNVLVRELEDIEGSEDIEADLAATITREKKLLAALGGRLEHAVRPHPRGRSKAAKR